jgi:hypothetical protein
MDGCRDRFLHGAVIYSSDDDKRGQIFKPEDLPSSRYAQALK